MADIKSEIIAWFNGPQDYDEGIALLKSVTKKDKVLGKLIKRGEGRSSFEKLVWELNKIAGLKTIPVPAAKVKTSLVKPAIIPDIPKKKGKKEKPPKDPEKTRYSLIGDRNIEDLPVLIKKLVRENSSLYMQRGKKHTALLNVGEGNDEDSISKRKALLGEIEKISTRLEELYKAWKTFEETGVVPDPAILWPKDDAKPDKKEKEALFPDTIEGLKAYKKNIQSSMVKDQNILAFGSKTKPKSGKGSPMPEGPKRTIIEKRISKKKEDVKKIDKLIADKT